MTIAGIELVEAFETVSPYSRAHSRTWTHLTLRRWHRRCPRRDDRVPVVATILILVTGWDMAGSGREVISQKLGDLSEKNAGRYRAQQSRLENRRRAALTPSEVGIHMVKPVTPLARTRVSVIINTMSRIM
jgi:hypothetical protein